MEIKEMNYDIYRAFTEAPAFKSICGVPEKVEKDGEIWEFFKLEGRTVLSAAVDETNYVVRGVEIDDNLLRTLRKPGLQPVTS